MNYPKDADLQQLEEVISQDLRDIQKTYELPQSDEIHERRAELCADVAIAYWKKDDFPAARKFFAQALEEYELLHDVFKIATTKGILGALLVQYGEYLIALTYLEEALEYWDTTNFLDERIACLQNLGIVYFRIHDEKKAVDLVLKTLQMSVQLQDELQFASTIQILLEYYEKLERYDMLLELKKKALEFWECLRLPSRQYKTLIDLGVISQITENYSQAIAFFKRAFNIAYMMNDLEKMYFSQGFIGECLLKQKDIEKANFTYLQAFKLAVFINSTKDFKNEVDKMRLILHTMGNSKEFIMKEEQKALEKH